MFKLEYVSRFLYNESSLATLGAGKIFMRAFITHGDKTKLEEK